MTDYLKRFRDINRYLQVFGVSKILLVFILVLMLLSALGQAVSIGLFVPFMNSLQQNVSTEESNRVIRFLTNLYSDIPADQQYFYILLSMLTLIGAVYLLMIVINILIMRFAVYRMQNEVCQKIFKELLNTRLKFFYKKKSGALINNLTTDVARGHTCMLYLLRMTSQLLIVSGYVLISFLIVPVYTAVLVGATIVLVLCFKKLSPFLYNLGVKNRAAEVDVKNMTVETLQGIRSVILSCAQEKHFQKFQGFAQKYYSTIFRSQAIFQSVPYLVNTIAVGIVGLFLLVNREYILTTNSEVFSKILFLIFIAGYTFKSLGLINSMYSSFAFSFEGIPVLLDLYDDLESFKVKRDGHPTEIKSFKDVIRVENLSFEYLAKTPIINGLNFDININQKVAFVGGSGSGKSTLIDVISGFHDDYEGTIQIDGKELREIRQDDWRNLVGYVSQESFLFNDTIRNNLLFGFDQIITDDELLQACQHAQIYETIKSFKDGLDTVLGERGVRLSGGEKQRLAIARIFLKNPAIVLLDEATSSLDSEAERKVKDALDELGKGRTVISVAHRLSTIIDYDMIHVLEQGRIVESGSHLELIAQEGKYYNYYTIQSLERSYV